MISPPGFAGLSITLSSGNVAVRATLLPDCHDPSVHQPLEFADAAFARVRITRR